MRKKQRVLICNHFELARDIQMLNDNGWFITNIFTFPSNDHTINKLIVLFELEDKDEH